MLRSVLVILLALVFTIAAAKDYGTFAIAPENVIKVYDGDTFFIRQPGCPPVLCERIGVRIAGIDTPEIRGGCPAERLMAERARLVLRKALKDADRIALLRVRKEKYGRLLGDLHVDGINVGQHLIEKGLAVAYDGGKKINWCQRLD